MHVNCSLTWQSSDAAVLLVVFFCLSVCSFISPWPSLSVGLVQRVFVITVVLLTLPTYPTYPTYHFLSHGHRSGSQIAGCDQVTTYPYYLTYFLLYFHCIVLHLLLTTSYYYSFLPTFSILLTQSSQLRHPVSLSFNSPLLCRHINVQEIC